MINLAKTIDLVREQHVVEFKPSNLTEGKKHGQRRSIMRSS